MERNETYPGDTKNQFFTSPSVLHEHLRRKQQFFFSFVTDIVRDKQQFQKNHLSSEMEFYEPGACCAEEI